MLFMRSKLDPLTAAEIEGCVRWALMWMAWARRARELGEWRMGDRFMQAGEEIFDRLEAML